jgi:hypothetical protein
MGRPAMALIAAWPGRWVVRRGGRPHRRHVSWIGSVTWSPGAAGPTLPAVRRDAYGRELAGLLEGVLAGDLGTDDWVDVERAVVSALATLERLYAEHEVDEQGRCLICREARWLWPRRAACTVRAAVAFHTSHVATAELRRCDDRDSRPESWLQRKPVPVSSAQWPCFK